MKKIIIGVTGSFGSGKSTVAKMLARLSNGCLVNADKLAKELVNGRLKARVIKEFATVNRKKLAGTVFSDKDKINKLNSIVHPAVKQEINKRIKNCKGVVVIDVPLLLEAGIRADKIVVVKAGLATQINRNKRFGKDEIIRRSRYQMPVKKKLKHADFAVDNNGSLKQTEKQVKKIWDKLKLEVV